MLLEASYMDLMLQLQTLTLAASWKVTSYHLTLT